MAAKHNTSIHRIDPRGVVAIEQGRWKCQFGCKDYGKQLSCPHVPGPEKTRKLLAEYQKAYITQFTGIHIRAPIDTITKN
ncbi:MAG TPA: DUF2284 domain-containing protein [Methanocella sp.]|nr:DUF2284 domain-containing protein [Methanocella sp.]